MSPEVRDRWFLTIMRALYLQVKRGEDPSMTMTDVSRICGYTAKEKYLCRLLSARAKREVTEGGVTAPPILTIWKRHNKDGEQRIGSTFGAIIENT